MSAAMEGTTRKEGHWSHFEAKLLKDAAGVGNLNIVKTLLEVYGTTCSQVDAAEQSPFEMSNVAVGERALMQAINAGHQDVVIYFLETGGSFEF